MDTAITALVLALIGLGLAFYAIIVGTRKALRSPKKSSSITDGLYRITQVGKEGLDTLFEIEEINEKETTDEDGQTIPEPRSEEASY